MGSRHVVRWSAVRLSLCLCVLLYSLELGTAPVHAADADRLGHCETWTLARGSRATLPCLRHWCWRAAATASTSQELSSTRFGAKSCLCVGKYACLCVYMIHDICFLLISYPCTPNKPQVAPKPHYFLSHSHSTSRRPTSPGPTLRRPTGRGRRVKLVIKFFSEPRTFHG